MEKLKARIIYLKSRHVIREFSWYALSNFTAQGLSFISILFVSRYLGPTNLGLFSFVQNYYTTIFTILSGSDFYFSWALARSEQYATDIKRFIVYRLHIAIILSTVGSIFAFIILPRDVAIMCMIMLAPTFLNSFMIFNFYALIQKRAKLVASIQICSALVTTCIKVFLVYIAAPLSYFVFASALDLTIISLTYLFVYSLHKKLIREVLASHTPKILETFRFIFDIRMNILVIFLWQLLLRIDQLILAKITNAYSLGIYAAAVKVAEIPNVLAGILYLTMISRMVPLIKSDSSHAHKNLRRVFYIYLLIGIFMSIMIVALAPFMIKVIYGQKFIESLPVLQVYALSIPGIYLTYFFFSLFGAIDKHKIQAIVFLASVILNVLLVVFLTPIYGLIGAAIATAVTYTLAGFCFYIYWRRKI
jgi:O-antigen/teichoic acid export membrane protein